MIYYLTRNKHRTNSHLRVTSYCSLSICVVYLLKKKQTIENLENKIQLIFRKLLYVIVIYIIQNICKK